MSTAMKDIRKQLKNIVIILLPEVIKEELFREIEKQMHKRMDEVAANVKETLHRIEDRSKDVNGYLVRSTLKQ